jgi:RNA polymerase sigma-70 factor, ECF subfamily
MTDDQMNDDQMNDDQITDDQLMKTLADRSSPEKSKKAFRSLFDRHGGLVLGYCIRILADKNLAEDVAQDVWMKVIQNSEKYEARGQLRPWLLTLSRNTCFNVLRSRRTQGVSNDTDIADISSELESETTLNPLSDMVAEAESRSLRELIDQLPASQRLALSLLLIEELSYSEIATAMGVSLTAVKTHIFRARKSLEKELRPRRST